MVAAVAYAHGRRKTIITTTLLSLLLSWPKIVITQLRIFNYGVIRFNSKDEKNWNLKVGLGC